MYIAIDITVCEKNKKIDGSPFQRLCVAITFKDNKHI